MATALLLLACDGEAAPGGKGGGGAAGASSGGAAGGAAGAPGALDAGPIGTLTGRQDGRPVCARGFREGPYLEVDALGVRVVGYCNDSAIVVRLGGDPATGSLTCLGVDTSRPCPQTVIRTPPGGGIEEVPLGEATGEARVAGGRLTGSCACQMPTSGGLPARTADARFDVAFP